MWEYRGRYVRGGHSHWLPEEETRDSFFPLQLGVLSWTGSPSAAVGGAVEGGEKCDRLQARREYPVGTAVWREFPNVHGQNPNAT